MPEDLKIELRDLSENLRKLDETLAVWKQEVSHFQVGILSCERSIRNILDVWK